MNDHSRAALATGEDDSDYSESSEVGERPEEDRDEEQEVRNMSSKETFRVHLWRYVVTGVLLMTAVAVTFTTYSFLRRQEDDNFKTAVSAKGKGMLSLGDGRRSR